MADQSCELIRISAVIAVITVIAAAEISTQLTFVGRLNRVVISLASSDVEPHLKLYVAVTPLCDVAL